MIVKGTLNYFLEENVDTDIIIPARFLKRTSLDGFQQFAFFEKKYTQNTKCLPTKEDRDFIFQNKEFNEQCSLNKKNTQGANFLLTWSNFGCGSSREHAVYALSNYKVIIGSAPKGKFPFADIFRDNCRQNLIFTPVLEAEDHAKLVKYVESNIDTRPIEISFEVENDQLVIDKGEISFKVELPQNHKEYILGSKYEDPFLIAKDQISSHLSNILKWEESNQKILNDSPSSALS